MRVIYADIDPEVALYELDVDEMNAMSDEDSDDPSDDEYDDTFGYLDDYDDYDDFPDEYPDSFRVDDLPEHLSRFSDGDNGDDTSDNPDGLWN